MNRKYYFQGMNGISLILLTFCPLGNSDHAVVLMSTAFPTHSKGEAPFHRIVYEFSRANWDGFRDHLNDVSWEGTFELL